MADYLLSLKLLVKRLHLDHEPTDMDLWTRKDSSGSQSGLFKSRDGPHSEDTNTTPDVVYRRQKITGSDAATSAKGSTAPNSAGEVFRYPSLSLKECRQCKAIFRTNSRERLGSSYVCFDCRRSQTDAKRSKSPPLLSVTDDTGNDQLTSICNSPTSSEVREVSEVCNSNGRTTAKLTSPNGATRRFSNNAHEASHNQELLSPLFRESSPSPRASSLGSSSHTDRKRSSVSSGKQRLSLSKSLPLSPQVVTKETRERQLCGMQLKLDTLKAELMAMRRTDQELARQLLQIHSEIQVQKVKRSCLKHSELLDDAIYEAEIADEFPEMCDLPPKSHSRLLTSNGVTNFNISCRRFSCS